MFRRVPLTLLLLIFPAYVCVSLIAFSWTVLTNYQVICLPNERCLLKDLGAVVDDRPEILRSLNYHLLRHESLLDPMERAPK